MPANNVMITPEGGLEWAKVLGEPRGFQDSTEDRSWSINLLLEEESAEMLISLLREEYMEYHGKKKPAQYGLLSTPMLTATKQQNLLLQAQGVCLQQRAQHSALGR